MSRDSGWIVLQSGTWVPVAHNASVSELSGFQRASFVSMDGTRRTAGRGYTPREWEISETVPYDWAQEIYTAYIASEGQEPVFFIPPLAAGSNYAPLLRTMKRIPVMDEEGNTSWRTVAHEGAQSDVFPVRPGLKLEFGGLQSGGTIRLRIYKSDFTTTATVYDTPANDMSQAASRKVTITSLEAAWARLESVGAVQMSGELFARIIDADFPTIRTYGPGGAWVTIDDFEINHNRIASKYAPMVTLKMNLTECERV